MNLKEGINKVTHLGLDDSVLTRHDRRTVFFNAILITLPVVYLVTMILDYQSYLEPISEWNFDNFSFPVFILICLICLALNKNEYVGVSKWIFILSWPFLLHIIPIRVQQTPEDYYFSFPLGLIFHSILIKALFSRSVHPLSYWVLTLLNFLATVYFFDYLTAHEDDIELITDNLLLGEYYRLGVILYWMLFNLLIGYLFEIIDNEMDRAEQSRITILEKNDELSSTLDKLKATQAQLVQSEKMSSIGTFTAGIAHEINNPLNFIMGGHKELQSAISGENQEELKKSIELADEMIGSGLDRATKIIRALLELSYKTNHSVKKKAVEISDLLNNSLLLVKSSVPSHVELIEQIETVGRVNAHPDQLHQVFLNVLSNALDEQKQSNQRQKICIRSEICTFDRKKSVSVKIHNTGSKLPDDLNHIFDPFYTTKEPGKGTGLGLWITYQIVEEHGGRIIPRNTEDGVEFEIILPLVA